MASPALLNTPQSSNAAIKELSGSGSRSSLPSLHASKGSDATDLDPVGGGEEIPIIDFSLLTKGTPDQRSHTVRELGEACQDWGCFLVVNHGVPESLKEAALDALKQFFDLTAEEKAEYNDTHVSNPIRYGTGFNTSSATDARYWRDYLKVITHPEFQFPAKPPGFRFLNQTSLNMETIGIWESMGVEERYMNEALGLEKCFQFFIGNRYPPCPQPDLAVGLPSHSNHGLLTVLSTNGVDGLEVNLNDKWVRVRTQLPNSFLVNTGDSLELQLNGRYKSVLHRAMVNSTSMRTSIASVLGPSMDAIVSPALPLVTDESPSAFRGLKYAEYVQRFQCSKLKERSILDAVQL